jgi:hypothetical protein
MQTPLHPRKAHRIREDRNDVCTDKDHVLVYCDPICTTMNYYPSNLHLRVFT